MMAQIAPSRRWPKVISSFRTRLQAGSHGLASPQRVSARRLVRGGPAIRTLPGLISRCGLVAMLLIAGWSVRAASLTASFASIPQGADVDLSVEGPVDWVH